MSAIQARASALPREKEPYFADFEILAKDGGARPAWLGDLRARSIATFADLAFPTIHDEDWKYTSVAPILGVPFRSRLSPDRAIGSRVRQLIATRVSQVVFVNGHHSAELSSTTPESVTVAALSAMPDAGGRLVEEHLTSYATSDLTAFTALNTALLGDVALIHVPRGRDIREPIYLTFVSTSDDDLTASHPRVLVVLDEDAQATVVETYVGLPEQRYFTNAVSEIVLGAGASIEHCKLVEESDRAFHVGRTQVLQGRDSHLSSISITTGGALVRNDLNVVLGSEGASCSLYGLYVTGDDQHVDNHTAIEHAKPHGTSRQVYKGILDGKSRAVFNGKVIVHKDAQKTDAQQTNRNLLLSGDAIVDTKPQLEIFADDVKCTHGAAIGQLDEEALFYLRSRGMSEQTAHSLLTYGFASEVVERISAEPLREHLNEKLRSILRQGW